MWLLPPWIFGTILPAWQYFQHTLISLHIPIRYTVCRLCLYYFCCMFHNHRHMLCKKWNTHKNNFAEGHVLFNASLSGLQSSVRMLSGYILPPNEHFGNSCFSVVIASNMMFKLSLEVITTPNGRPPAVDEVDSVNIGSLNHLMRMRNLQTWFHRPVLRVHAPWPWEECI